MKRVLIVVLTLVWLGFSGQTVTGWSRLTGGKMSIQPTCETQGCQNPADVVVLECNLCAGCVNAAEEDNTVIFTREMLDAEVTRQTI